jgi:hypothetical protein
MKKEDEKVTHLKKPVGWAIPNIYTKFDISINGNHTTVEDVDMIDGHHKGHCLVYETKKEAGKNSIPIYAIKHIRKSDGYTWFTYSFSKTKSKKKK